MSDEAFDAWWIGTGLIAGKETARLAWNAAVALRQRPEERLLAEYSRGFHDGLTAAIQTGNQAETGHG